MNPFSGDHGSSGGESQVVRVPTRGEVRQAVQRDQEVRLAAAQSGKNIHQLSLDQLDQVHAYAAALSEAHGPDAAATFLNLWAEETEAATSHLQHQTEQIQLQAAQRESANESTGQAIGGIIGILLLGWIFWMMLNP